jgi:hypothetical protein
MEEERDVRACGKLNLDLSVRGKRVVVTVQTFADVVGADPDTGIGAGVVGRVAPQQHHSYQPLFQRIGVPLERTQYDVTEKLATARTRTKGGTGTHSLEYIPNLFVVFAKL